MMFAGIALVSLLIASIARAVVEVASAASTSPAISGYPRHTVEGRTR